MAVRSSLKRTGSGLGPIEKAVAQLAKTRLLVGIPGDSAPRPSAPGEKGTPPSNALVGYVMEFGDDDRNIPPRPFLRPGVRAALLEIRKGMLRPATGALSGKPSEVKDGFDQAGLMAAASVKRAMVDGPFVPLSQRTIEARARRTKTSRGTKGAKDYLRLQAEGTPEWALQSADLVKPLIDTGNLLASVVYIVEEK